MKKTVWDISYELECMVEEIFNAKFDHTGIIFDRATIERDMFYDVMHLLLHLYGGDGTFEFLDKHHDIKRKDMNQIINFEEIFEEFKKLIKQ